MDRKELGESVANLLSEWFDEGYELVCVCGEKIVPCMESDRLAFSKLNAEETYECEYYSLDESEAYFAISAIMDHRTIDRDCLTDH